jgi:hypothetical protein
MPSKEAKMPEQEKLLEFNSLVETYADSIRNEIASCILMGVSTFLREHRLTSQYTLETERERLAWLLAVETCRYNAIYFINRRDAQKHREFVLCHRDLLNEIGNLVAKYDNGRGIINYAFHAFVQDFARRPGKKVRFSKKSIPPYCMQTHNEHALYVREKDFFGSTPVDSFHALESLGDWHDFSHFLAACVSDGAFGVKYHHGLDKLAGHYRDLTAGTGMQDASGSLYSDGILFTQLSRPIFDTYYDKKHSDGNRNTMEEIEYLIAKELFAYLCGNKALYHPGVKREIAIDHLMNPLELAVCMQNKRYERRGAEYEIAMFVRGTPDGPRGDASKDPLYRLNTAERILFVATLQDSRVYFEQRNISRHRAHEIALGLLAQEMLSRKETQKATNTTEIDLLKAIISFHNLDDLQAGQEINLYQIVGEIIEK